MGSCLQQNNLANKSHVIDLGTLFGGCSIFLPKREKHTNTTDEFHHSGGGFFFNKKDESPQNQPSHKLQQFPCIASFYGIFTCIYHKNQPTHVGKYAIFDGSYGDSSPKFCVFNPRFSNFTTTLRVAKKLRDFFLVPTARWLFIFSPSIHSLYARQNM